MRKLALILLLVPLPLATDAAAQQSVQTRQERYQDCLREAEIVRFDQTKERALPTIERRRDECIRMFGPLPAKVQRDVEDCVQRHITSGDRIWGDKSEANARSFWCHPDNMYGTPPSPRSSLQQDIDEILRRLRELESKQ